MQDLRLLTKLIRQIVHVAESETRITFLLKDHFFYNRLWTLVTAQIIVSRQSCMSMTQRTRNKQQCLECLICFLMIHFKQLSAEGILNGQQHQWKILSDVRRCAYFLNRRILHLLIFLLEGSIFSQCFQVYHRYLWTQGSLHVYLLSWYFHRVYLLVYRTLMEA